MFYGDLHLIDILIFAGIAAFLFFRLGGVLGKKTGFEKKGKKNISLENFEEKNKKEETKINSALEEDLQPGFENLKTAYSLINKFDHNEFLEGAKRAFEMIVVSFNEGNKSSLKPLLTKDVFVVFCKAIDDKKNQDNNQILSIEIESIDKVEKINKKIFITIAFLSTQIDSKTDKQKTKKDIWTFEKKTNEKGPGWLLAST